MIANDHSPSRSFRREAEDFFAGIRARTTKGIAYEVAKCLYGLAKTPEDRERMPRIFRGLTLPYGPETVFVIAHPEDRSSFARLRERFERRAGAVFVGAGANRNEPKRPCSVQGPGIP